MVSTTDPVKVTNEITNWALSKNIALNGFTVQKPTLEDIYLELVGNDDPEARQLSDVVDVK